MPLDDTTHTATPDAPVSPCGSLRPGAGHTATLRLYAVRLDNGRSSTARFAVYQQEPSGDLVPLWGQTVGNKLRAVFPHQVISKRSELPACHFALSGCGYSKAAELASSLAQHFGRDVELVQLHGWLPSVAHGHVVAEGVR